MSLDGSYLHSYPVSHGGSETSLALPTLWAAGDDVLTILTTGPPYEATADRFCFLGGFFELRKRTKISETIYIPMTVACFFEIRRKKDWGPYLLSPSLEHQMNSGRKQQIDLIRFDALLKWHNSFQNAFQKRLMQPMQRERRETVHSLAFKCLWVLLILHNRVIKEALKQQTCNTRPILYEGVVLHSLRKAGQGSC